jgi:hypothetical protein
MSPIARAAFATLATVLLLSGFWIYVVTAAERARIRGWVAFGGTTRDDGMTG